MAAEAGAIETALVNRDRAVPRPGGQVARWQGPTQHEVAIAPRSRWSLARRMSLMLAALVMVVVADVAIVSIAEASANAAHATALAGKQTSSDVAGLQLDMQRQQSALLGYETTRDQIYLNDLTAARADGRRILSHLKSDPLDSREDTYVSQLEGGSASWQAWADKRRQVIASSKPGAAVDPVDAETGALLMESFNRSAIVFQNYSDTRAAQASDLAAQRSALIGRVTLATGGLSLLIVVLLAIAFFRQTLRPVRDLVRAAVDLANGQIASVPWTARRDEMGQLAKALAAWSRASAERMALARTMSETSTTADVNHLLAMATARLQEELAAAQIVAVLGLGSQWRVVAASPRPYCAGTLLARSPEADALRAGRMLSGDLRTLECDPELRAWVHGSDLGPVLSMPLVSGGQVLGVISAIRRINQPQFGALDDQLADIIVPPLSAAIHVALLRAELESASERRRPDVAERSGRFA